MAMNTSDTIEKLFNHAQAKLIQDKNNLQELCQKQKDTDIGKFLDRFLSWGTDKELYQARWEMFHRVIDFNEYNFFDSLTSFAINNFLDDSSFRIEWRKTYIDKNFNIVWLSNGEFKTVLTSKDDPKAEPIVVQDNDIPSSIPSLMEAMDYKESKIQKRQNLED